MPKGSNERTKFFVIPSLYKHFFARAKSRQCCIRNKRGRCFTFILFIIIHHISSFLAVQNSSIGFVDEIFWICRRIFLDLSPNFCGFVGQIFWICQQFCFGFVNNFVLDFLNFFLDLSTVFFICQQFCFRFLENFSL